MHDAARRDFYAKVDAANVDLKAFTEEFYKRITFAELAPVLETLEYLARETKVWLEITTLLIPGHNDSEAEVTRLSEWVMGHLGPDVPLHFTAFHPDFKMMNVPRTPPETLRRSREIARRAGLHFVYTGNVHDVEGDTTYCPGCGEALIARDWHDILEYRLTARGECSRCQAIIPGHYEATPGAWGRRRVPVAINRAR
jgi:pyruvate formate lyase activating enzyme